MEKESLNEHRDGEDEKNCEKEKKNGRRQKEQRERQKHANILRCSIHICELVQCAPWIWDNALFIFHWILDACLSLCA